MSIMHILDCNESIYAISERIDEAPEVFIEKKYRSRYFTEVRNEKKEMKSFRSRATMGPARVAVPNPEDFLRKRTGRQSVPLYHLSDKKNKRFLCSLSAKRPDVPLKDIVISEQKEKLKHRTKNFISANINAVANMTVNNPSRIKVVDASGSKVIMRDGLQPKYIYSTKFGNIPKYIKDMQDKRNADKNFSKNDIPKDKFKYIESSEILAGLKKNWSDLQQEFQKLPLLIDTIPKILRKQKLESLINQLEKDILLLEKHSYIYVYDNDNSKTSGSEMKLHVKDITL